MPIIKLETRRLSRLVEEHNQSNNEGQREILLDKILTLKHWIEDHGGDVCDLVPAPN